MVDHIPIMGTEEVTIATQVRRISSPIKEVGATKIDAQGIHAPRSKDFVIASLAVQTSINTVNSDVVFTR